MRLFICNLSWDATPDELKSWLTTVWGYTVDDVKIISDRETGRSRGFGFVEFPVEEQGHNALRDLDGADFMGRDLKVNLATRKEPANRQNSSREFREPARHFSEARKPETDRRNEAPARRRDRSNNDWKW
jgi:RNA recognition motif-containing protein